MNVIQPANTAVTPAPVPTPAPIVSNETAELIQKSKSPNTIKAYQFAAQKFNAWLGKRIPNDTLIAEYLTTQHKNGKSPATCSQIVSAIQYIAHAEGVENPVGAITRATLQGIRRDGKERGRGSVHGIQRVEMRDMARTASKRQTKRGLRDCAIIRVMSDGLLRVSELCAIEVEDIEKQNDGSGILTIRHSKTDQEGKGRTIYLGMPTIDAVDKWKAVSKVQDGVLFRRVWKENGKVGNNPLTTNGVRDMLKARAKEAGIDARVSGHSLRIGSAESLAERGATLVQLQNAGRWSNSQMPAHYTRKQAASKSAVARLFYNQ